MATITVKARAVGVDRVVRRFLAAADRLPTDVREAQRELGRSAEVVFAAHAPHRSGRLSRGISSSDAGGKVIVHAFAANPASGYDYVGVTRFGHKVARIYPKHRSFGAHNLATRKRRGGETLTHGFDSFTSQAALRFSVGGKVLFRRSVAGYHPDSDWAEDALPEVEAQAEAAAGRLGHRIEARF